MRREAVRRARAEAELCLAEETGDPHLEELVEVRGEDRAELDPLEQRDGLVTGQLEHAGVEVEQRQLAIEEPLLRVGADASWP